MSVEQYEPAAVPAAPGGARRGRPVLGAVSGLLFGVFLAMMLQQFGVRPLDSLSVIGLPVIGLLAGFALGRWAPLARRGPGTAVR